MEAGADMPGAVPAVEPLADSDRHDPNPIVPEIPDGGEEIEPGCGI